MTHLSDIEIAQSTSLKPISEVIKSLNVDEEYVEQYGKYKAKIDYNFLNTRSNKS